MPRAYILCDQKCMFFTNNHGHIYKPVDYSHYEYLVAAYVTSGIYIRPWLLMPKQCGIERVNTIIYIFLLYVIFHQHLKITFRKFSAPVPEKIHSLLLTQSPPKSSEWASQIAWFFCDHSLMLQGCLCQQFLSSHS